MKGQQCASTCEGGSDCCSTLAKLLAGNERNEGFFTVKLVERLRNVMSHGDTVTCADQCLGDSLEERRVGSNRNY